MDLQKMSNLVSLMSILQVKEKDKKKWAPKLQHFSADLRLKLSKETKSPKNLKVPAKRNNNRTPSKI